MATRPRRGALGRPGRRDGRHIPVAWRWLALVAVLVTALGARAYFDARAQPITAAPDDPEARVAAAMIASLGEPHVKAREPLPVGRRAAALEQEAAPLPQSRRVIAEGGLVLKKAPFLDAPAKADGFVRFDGTDLGFERLPLPPLYETAQTSINEYAALAAGDVNADGWPDVAVGTAHGPFLYVNTGGRFELQRIGFPWARGRATTYVALVDLDGSGAPDLFLCTWMGGCHILFNDDGSFSAASRAELPRGRELATHAAAFADIDRDGHVDIVTGPAVGLAWQFVPPGRGRVWYGQGGGRFRAEALKGPTGETLSLLFVDLDGDGWQDLIAGNDFDEPDVIYRNHEGRLRPLTQPRLPFPRSTESTMSLDSGDIDNDGRLEIYDAAIAYGGIPKADLERQRVAPHDACRIGFSQPQEIRNCLELGEFQTAVVRSRDITDVRECAHFSDARSQRQCIAVGYLWNEAFADLPQRGATRDAVLDVCSKMPAGVPKIDDVCAAVPGATMDYGQNDKLVTDQMPQVKNTNLLFTPGDEGYQDVTERYGVAFGGWSWNAKFADVDNDTWQDLYITQGTRLRFSNSSNLLYRNVKGEGFRERGRRFGLQHHVPTGGSLFIDYDVDGRLDIITHPFGLTPVIWRNEVAPARAFELSLRDETSPNGAAIGARVRIASDDGRLQVREVKAGGGFESDDVKVVRFGLGEWPGVSSISVTWPDGAVDTLAVRSLDPGRYTLVRMRAGSR